MNWGMKKLPFLWRVRKKVQKSVKPYLAIPEPKTKKPGERRCAVKKGMEILKGGGAKSV
jgi:hypothetical protein